MTDQIFPPKKAASTVLLSFEFISDLAVGETLSGTEVVTNAVYSGTDANPAAMVSGAAVQSGTQIRQTITGGTVGNIYLLTCTAQTSLSNTLVKRGKLAVV